MQERFNRAKAGRPEDRVNWIHEFAESLGHYPASSRPPELTIEEKFDKLRAVKRELLEALETLLDEAEYVPLRVRIKTEAVIAFARTEHTDIPEPK